MNLVYGIIVAQGGAFRPVQLSNKINQYYQQAAQALSRLSLPQERTAVLWDYAQSMLNRKS